MIDIIAVILPIFLVIVLGLLLNKSDLLNDNFIEVSNRLIYYVFFPVLLFHNISNSDFKEEFSLVPILVLIISTMAIYILGFAIAKMLKLNMQQTGTFVMDSFRGNIGYIGLALCFYVYGQEGLTAAGIVISFATPLVNFLSIVALGTTNSSSFRFLTVVKDVLLNPLIIASIAGIIASLSGIIIPLFIDRTLAIISNITLPLALIAIGATMNIKQIRGSRLVIACSSVIKLIILPGIALVIFKTIGDSSIIAKTTVLLLACPTAAVTYIVAQSMGGDPDLANATIVISTIASIFTFVLWLQFLGF